MPKQSFKNRPLRQAGDSGRYRVLDRLTHEVVWLVGAMGLVGVIGGFNAGLRLGMDFGQFISRPIAWTIFAVCLAAMGVVILMVLRRAKAAMVQFENEGLGIQGERVVADALNELTRDGVRVFHDVPPERDGDGLANFDHVVIGPTGVFVIETKARSKKEGADNKIVVGPDGRVLVNGVAPDRCPITQAKILRDAMKSMLERQTSLRNIFVRGVVMFPEWQIEDREYRKAGGDIWTLNPPAFKKWLTNGRDPVVLTSSDVALLSSRIEDHVRRDDR